MRLAGTPRLVRGQRRRGREADLASPILGGRGMPDRAPLPPRRHRSRERGSHGSSPVAVAVAVAMAMASLMSCGSAFAATPASVPAASYLFSIPTASGSLTGPDDRHLTLRLTGARDYLTRFTDRPLRDASVVADVDFARRFETYFAGSAPNAVLSYTPRGAQIPVSIVLTIRQPRWNGQHHTWTFPASRVRKQPDNLPDTTVHIKPPLIPNPGSFTQATLMIDGTSNCWLEEDCVGANLAGVNFSGINVEGVNFTGAVLTGADFHDARLFGTNFSDARLADANLTGATFFEAILSSDYAPDYVGANFTGDVLNDTDLAGANFFGANFTDAVVYYSDSLQFETFAGANTTGALFYQLAGP
jgi:Pentapeptide repeats (8 copies)